MSPPFFLVIGIWISVLTAYQTVTGLYHLVTSIFTGVNTVYLAISL